MSTIAGDRPYCSLMCYACNDDCTEIYLVTHRDTTKFQNLITNHNVSLLVDSRENSHFSEVQALTIEGRFVPVEDNSEETGIRNQFIACHPDLREFTDHADAEWLRIKIQSFLLLKGLQNAHYIRIAS